MRLRYLILICALIFSFGLVSRVQAQTTVSLLVNAHTALAHADHDYDGRRAMAMKEIQAAIHDLAGTSNVRVRTHTHVRYYHRSKANNKEPETQSTSDSQLRTAEDLLQQASDSLSGNAYQHVNAAIAHLNAALSVR